MTESRPEIYRRLADEVRKIHEDLGWSNFERFFISNLHKLAEGEPGVAKPGQPTIRAACIKAVEGD